MKIIEFPGAATVPDGADVFVLGSRQAQNEACLMQLGRDAVIIDTSGHVPFDASLIVRSVRAGHSPVIVITDDYFHEVGTWLEENPELDFSRCSVYYVPTVETRYDLAYRARYRDTPLRDIIVFRSGPHASAYVAGMDFSDNALALFEYMLREHLNERYELVWFVKSPEAFEERYRSIPNVTFLPFSGSDTSDAVVRDRYYEKLCLAKWIFFTDAYGFCRNAREDQVRVQLWHGCGFKTRVNFVPCEHRYEYNIVVSPLYQKIHAKIFGLREDQVLVTGYPKEDWLFHPATDWPERLGLPCASKYIFWLPTFRKVGTAGLENLDTYDMMGDTGLPVVQDEKMLEHLEQELAASDAVLVIKLHPFQDARRVHVGRFPHICLLTNETLRRADLQINEILADADALVSDYSSVAIDFMVLDRPIAFTVSDMEAYVAARGFVFEDILGWLPGAHLRNFEDFQSFVRDVCHGKDRTAALRARLNQKMHSFFDDQSSRRVCEALGIGTGGTHR